jgi:hypothetical protein
MQSLLILSIIALFSFQPAPGQNGSTSLAAEDLKNWNGLWTGTLSYRDYTSDEMVTLELNGNCYIKGNKLVLDYVINEWGKVFNQHYVYKVQDGTLFHEGGAWTLIEKSNDPDGNLRFVVTKKGRDGNERQRCTFRKTFVYTGDTLTVTKEVEFEGTAGYFLRNEYRLSRVSG